MGCAWELPERKDAQNCTIKPSVNIKKDLTNNKLAFSITLSSVTEVASVVYNIKGPGTATATTPSGIDYLSGVSVTIGGAYEIEAKITDKCGNPPYSVKASFSTEGCVAPKSDLTVNPSQTDPKLTTFTLENATDVKTLVWKVNGTAVTNTNSNTVILSYNFERGKTYEVIAEYTDNCGTKGTSKGTYTSAGCNAPTTVTVVQPSTSPVELTAKLEGGVLTDIGGTVNWKISPAGTIKASTNSEVTFQGLNPDSPYTITAEFKTTCQTPGTVSGSGRTAQAVVTTKNAWSVKGGGPSDGVSDMILDENNNIYITGTFQSSDLDFGNNVKLSNGGRKAQIYVAKYNNQGVCQWASAGGSTEDDEVSRITVDNNGNLYIIGTIRAAGVFGSLAIPAYYGSSDVFVAKLDRDIGRWVWVNTLGGGDTDFGRGIVYSSSNNQLYLSGTLKGNGNTTIKRNNNANTDNYSLLDYDVFFVLCNPATGSINTPDVIGGSGFQESSDMAVDPSGNVYLTGRFTVQFTFKNSASKLTSSGSFDIFIAKWNITSGWEWSKKSGGAGSDESSAICIDSNKNTYITGQYNASNPDFNNIPSAGDYNVFWASYSSSGTLRWSQGGGGYGQDRMHKVRLGDDGNLILCGQFQQASLFPFNIGTSVNSKGNSDFLAFKANTSSGSRVGDIVTGGDTGEDGAGIALVKGGKMYVAGSFQGNVNISGTALSAFSASISNIFVAKF